MLTEHRPPHVPVYCMYGGGAATHNTFLLGNGLLKPHDHQIIDLPANWMNLLRKWLVSWTTSVINDTYSHNCSTSLVHLSRPPLSLLPTQNQNINHGLIRSVWCITSFVVTCSLAAPLKLQMRLELKKINHLLTLLSWCMQMIRVLLSISVQAIKFDYCSLWACISFDCIQNMEV